MTDTLGNGSCRAKPEQRLYAGFADADDHLDYAWTNCIETGSNMKFTSTIQIA